MTKPVTAVALLMLLEEGRIALDDTVPRIHSGIRRPEAAEAARAEARHDGAGSSAPHRRLHLWLSQPHADRCRLSARSSIAEIDTEGGLPAMIAQLAKLPLEYSPGDAWIYSVATDVVGYLVELVSGQSLCRLRAATEFWRR